MGKKRDRPPSYPTGSPPRFFCNSPIRGASPSCPIVQNPHFGAICGVQMQQIAGSARFDDHGKRALAWDALVTWAFIGPRCRPPAPAPTKPCRTCIPAQPNGASCSRLRLLHDLRRGKATADAADCGFCTVLSTCLTPCPTPTQTPPCSRSRKAPRRTKPRTRPQAAGAA